MRTVIAALLGALLLAPPALAHEPLWGETPTVFGFGVIHPEVKVGYLDAGDTRAGRSRLRMFHQEYMVDYAPSTDINLRLEAMWRNAEHTMRVRGRERSVVVAGMGDIMIRAKRRFKVHQDVGLNVQQSLLYGLKLPTGESDHRGPDGKRLAPHDQTGTGKLGVMLGYAWDRETLADTVWASAVWHRDVGGGFAMGDMVELDVAYGPWLIRANQAADLGLNLALGMHAEYHGQDRLANGNGAGNQGHVVGLQLTPIVTKGRNQYRVGVFVPLLRGGEGTDYPYEVRFAFETFF